MHNEMKLKLKTVMKLFCFSFISSCGQFYVSNTFSNSFCETTYCEMKEATTILLTVLQF